MNIKKTNVRTKSKIVSETFGKNWGFYYISASYIAYIKRLRAFIQLKNFFINDIMIITLQDQLSIMKHSVYSLQFFLEQILNQNSEYSPVDTAASELIPSLWSNVPNLRQLSLIVTSRNVFE